MKIPPVLLFFLSALLAGCGGRTGQPARLWQDHKVYEYRNEYRDSLLVRTLVVSCPAGKGSAPGNFEPEEEHIYYYCDGHLTGRYEYWFTANTVDGPKVLWKSERYASGEWDEERMEWHSASIYRHRRYDGAGNIIRQEHRTVSGDEEYSYVEDGHTIEYFEYDTSGRVTRVTEMDSLTGRRRLEYRFYDSIPRGAVISPGADVVLFRDSVAGDTTFTRRELNGRLDILVKHLYKEDRTLELVYDAAGDVATSEEVIRRGADSLQIVAVPQFGSVDSTFYSAGQRVKVVTASPELLETRDFSYDEFGNISLEERITVYYE